jgi:transcriptional regulator with XRE-family HTH domain
MTNQSSGSYLRTHRKRSGLSQHEVARVLGIENGGLVCRYELGHHLPPLLVALGLEALFQVPISQLFRGLGETVTQTVEDRLLSLGTELQSRSGKGPQAAITAKKLQWLTERRNVQVGA